ncbi:hypothetical protein RJ55_01573 [Drechmeria coniospora]|nr:hypothetical protein RJ55_01573 [Drechmeria coniospora]
MGQAGGSPEPPSPRTDHDANQDTTPDTLAPAPAPAPVLARELDLVGLYPHPHFLHSQRLLPRPKKSPSTCSACRARKVRCDGLRPLCSNCQRLSFPCSYDDDDADVGHRSLPRRRAKRACLACHGRKARCSGHVPSCDRCRAQGLECVYRPSRRRTAPRETCGQADAGPDGDDAADDAHPDSDTPLTDRPGTETPSTLDLDLELTCPDESFDALVRRTLDQFFRHVHHIPMYSFLHRASLMEQYNAGKVDKALLLALVGITSCLTDMGPGLADYGDRCVDNAEALIFAHYTRPSTFKIQALVFIVKHRILSSKFSSAFILFSLASRFAAALRLNYDNPNLCFLARESRRRLIWSLYCMDSAISSGHRDFSLWRADNLHICLPCNERNFEFDLPQQTEKLIPPLDEPAGPRAEDVGSIALHVRIFHLRQKISEFTKSLLVGPAVDALDLQATVLSLHQHLDDFANRLPASFQFSENSLRLRAYSPRICVFVMIHVWWRQCHCDLYRVALAGFRDALPRRVLDCLDDGFVRHCRRQCLDHSLAMADIFSKMQKLGAKPVADLDLALCAYQCARMLKYAFHVGTDTSALTADAVTAQARLCLRTIRQCCAGPAAASIGSDLEALIDKGLGPASSPTRSPEAFRIHGALHGRGPARNAVLGSIEVSDDPDVVAATNGTFASAPAADMSRLALPSAMMTDPWPSSADFAAAADGGQLLPAEAALGTANARGDPDFAREQLNSAYEGALDGPGLDNGLDHAMGIDLTPWLPTGDFVWPEFLNGSVGV